MGECGGEVRSDVSWALRKVFRKRRTSNAERRMKDEEKRKRSTLNAQRPMKSEEGRIALKD